MVLLRSKKNPPTYSLYSPGRRNTHAKRFSWWRSILRIKGVCLICPIYRGAQVALRVTSAALTLISDCT